MQRTLFPQKFFSLADALVLLVIAAVIYAIVATGNEWRAEFHPLTKINLSAWALPKYVLLSATRGIVAYLISLTFTLVVGYMAARSATAERIIIPMLDILQSIPVLGFLPGLVLGLIALFPRTNFGLEFAAILMIFTGQVWNMTFAFYSSLKSIPSEFEEASTVIGLSRLHKFLRVELPFSAVNLTWNSLLSMAGGWFFLSVCEAFTLGDREYRLPGIGSYMAVAVSEGNKSAMLLGIGAMILLILTMDFVIWRPLLAWVQRFRMDGETAGGAGSEPLMGIVIRESRILRWLKVLYRRYQLRHRFRVALKAAIYPPMESEPTQPAARAVVRVKRIWKSRKFARTVEISATFLTVITILWGAWQLLKLLETIPLADWAILLRNTFWTFLRVMIALALSTLWAVPVGIWIGVSPRRIRIAQPIIQVLASFPAPMLYPLALAVLFRAHIGFDWASMFLMLLGVQWYVLFNVLAGALRIPTELGYALSLMETSVADRWKMLYLPSVFPALVTGWVTAAGGAWNASIVAEAITFHGEQHYTAGLGSTIGIAAANQDFRLLAASLSIMVLVVVLLNRGVWSRVYHAAQTRYRMDM